MRENVAVATRVCAHTTACAHERPSGDIAGDGEWSGVSMVARNDIGCLYCTQSSDAYPWPTRTQLIETECWLFSILYRNHLILLLAATN